MIINYLVNVIKSIEKAKTEKIQSFKCNLNYLAYLRFEIIFVGTVNMFHFKNITIKVYSKTILSKVKIFIVKMY